MLFDDDPPEPLGAIDDDRLRLVFTCCHPALADGGPGRADPADGRRATVPEIARAFLVQEAAMGRRITRAKAKIKAAGIPYRVPAARTCRRGSTACSPCSSSSSTRATWPPGPETEPVRADLTAEAIRLDPAGARAAAATTARWPGCWR